MIYDDDEEEDDGGDDDDDDDDDGGKVGDGVQIVAFNVEASKKRGIKTLPQEYYSDR